MSEQTRVSHPKERLLSADVEGFDSLAELALDMRSSWNHATDQAWRQLDPLLWELTHNPWVVLQTVSREKLQRVLADPAFRKNVDDLVQARRDAAEAPAWFQQTYPQSALSYVAYFSMGFMLSEALPANRRRFHEPQSRRGASNDPSRARGRKAPRPQGAPDADDKRGAFAVSPHQRTGTVSPRTWRT